MTKKELTARGAATRQRIIDAATEEFAQHGIAGARVERIVAAARTNKAQLYDYFGNKDGLFDAIFGASLERIVDVVPIDSSDLPDWAVRLYDEYLEHPSLIRLATWARLERRPAGHLVEDADRLDDRKLALHRRRPGGGDDMCRRAVRHHGDWSSACPWPGHRSAMSMPRPRRNRSTVHDARRELARCVRREVVRSRSVTDAVT